jgi:hypothetical protein
MRKYERQPANISLNLFAGIAQETFKARELPIPVILNPPQNKFDFVKIWVSLELPSTHMFDSVNQEFL